MTIATNIPIAVLNTISAIFLFLLTSYAYRIGIKSGFSALWKYVSLGFAITGIGRIMLAITEWIDVSIGLQSAQIMVYTAISISTFGTFLIVVGLMQLLKYFNGDKAT